MRKVTLFLTVILLFAALFTGCDTPAATEPQVTEAPASATVETAAPTDAPTAESLPTQTHFPYFGEESALEVGSEKVTVYRT